MFAYPIGGASMVGVRLSDINHLGSSIAVLRLVFTVTEQTLRVL